MNKGTVTALAVVAALSSGLAIGWRGTGVRGSADGIAKAKQPPADQREVKLTPELQKRGNLKVEPVKKEQLSPTLRLVGSVNFDANHVAEIGARIEGRVARMLVTLGDTVERGQALVEIESNELGDAFASLLSARANLIAAEHNEKRESGLLAQQLASATIVERARAEVKALAAEVHGAEQRLLAMGFTSEELERLKAGRGPRHVTLRSPLAGQVVARNAVLGQVVNPTQPILRVADLDRVWVELDLFERDLAHVSIGNSAEIHSESHPQQKFQGRVTHIEATVDWETRTARVRVEVDNDDRLLRPGQFVTARLATAGEQRETLSVPRNAVLRVDGEVSVFVALGDDRYIARPVELGLEIGDRAEITRGLVEGDQVVTEGAFVLKSELLR